ncbi:Perchlorate reductase subunit gamma precursor [Roseimaritima multifibrata]|uniref:Perchlorate reductase subunit gamma n=1 Tax=Roseimaritima multifibrata TaxID=1930274 RepID=A0A517MJR1_9BACT|nr:cytochrome c family protein [Roseimaritima multifibrata]QDS95136.1 Perchlorate reductase subunit gamma precursor [Roseimaritima multifibrata]
MKSFPLINPIAALGFFLVSLLGTALPCLAADPSGMAAPSDSAVAADPHSVLGVQTCVKCHASEVEVWKKTPHSQTFEQLHRRPEAREIAAKLNVSSIKYDGRCVACHYTQQADPAAGNQVSAISGVSCESCHGAAKDWLDIHHDYGGSQATRESESPAHRQQRLENSIANGMRNPHNLYRMAQSCYRCHTVGDEELVNVGGHTAGSLDFEMVTWSQGLVRHNFVRSNGKSNEASTKQRLRVMFVAGLIADLESSLRAVASATVKDTFGVTVAKRADRAAKRLKSAQGKLNNRRLAEVLAVYGSIKLKLGNAGPLSAAADEIAQIGVQFASESDGSDLEAIDRYVPAPSKWK